MLFVVVATQAVAMSYAATISVDSTPTNNKGILIGVQYTVWGDSGGPAFSTLKAAGFTMVGTVAFSNFLSSDWSQLKKWIQAAHDYGFTTFVIIGDPTTFSSAVDMSKRVAAMNVDVIILDEPISRYSVTKQQLQKAINDILAVNKNVHFIIDEYVTANIQEAYQWTTPYPCVRVATDDYYSQSTITLGISLASQEGKRAAAWIAFAQDNMAVLTPCYSNLNNWLGYVKGKPVDVFFYYAGAAGGWQLNWPKVLAF
jgi:hypothetical protein